MSDFNENNPGGAPPPYSQPASATVATGADERTWAMFGHLSSFSGVLIPFGSILGPLVVWLVK
jgi:uncharacterized Tic20 family protein